MSPPPAMPFGPDGVASPPVDVEQEEEEEAAVAAGGLPEGWEVAVSRSTGEPYYINIYTNETQFEAPTQPAAALVDYVDEVDSQGNELDEDATREEQHRAATQIQAVHRRKQVSAEYRSQRASTIAIQQQVRGKLARDEYRRQQDATQRLQAAHRGWSGRKQVAELKQAKAMEAASQKLHAAERGRAARKQAAVRRTAQEQAKLQRERAEKARAAKEGGGGVLCWVWCVQDSGVDGPPSKEGGG